ncbi:MAG: hypothetical protein HKO68_11860, partial [Desulfobacterales bacterium]|nr:hypothetical protein [Desulfobacterales bacterium]
MPKKYSLDAAKIPSSVKAARCRACGHVIPLKRALPNKPQREDPIRTISCRYCGQSYDLRTAKIPPGAAAIKCKSCGHSVPLKQKKGPAPVHSLKTESALPASEMLEGKPPKHLSQQKGSLHITCESCRTKYKIRKPKIPPSAVAFRCKTCGNQIPLPSFTTIKAVEDRERYRGPQSGVIPEKATKRVSWFRKKKWLIAAAAGIILTVIFGILVGSK